RQGRTHRSRHGRADLSGVGGARRAPQDREGRSEGHLRQFVCRPGERSNALKGTTGMSKASANHGSAATYKLPDGHRMAVIVTLLFENWSDGQAPNYSPMTTSLKPGTYDRAGVTWSQYGGNAGIWRLIRILDEFGIKATVCANARSVELY